MKNISEKQYKGKFVIIKGEEILNNVEKYNEIFGSNIKNLNQMRFFIFADEIEEQIKNNELEFEIIDFPSLLNKADITP